MKNRIRVFANGTTVMIGAIPQHEAIIVSVMIAGFNDIQYRLVWYDGKIRHEEWVYDCEISTSKEKIESLIITELTSRVNE